MNLPSKIKIIKAHDGLPPVGTVMIKMDGDDYRFKTLMNVTVFLALEAGYAEPVVEQWQAWERRKEIPYYFIGDCLNVETTSDEGSINDDERFDRGNYFTTNIIFQARDRILETLKQFHKEHKTQ